MRHHFRKVPEPFIEQSFYKSSYPKDLTGLNSSLPHYHSSQWTPGAAIRSGDWKLIEFYDLETTELYNLADDIGEKHDLSETFPDKRDELKKLLLKMQNETGAILPEKNSEFIQTNEQNLP